MGGGGGGNNRVEETPHEKELARIAAEQFGRYQEVFQPVEDAFIEDVRSIDEGDEEIAAGMTAADTARSTDAATDEATAQAMGAGATPGSGRFNDAVTDTARAGAEAGGFGVAGARRGTEDRAVAGKMAAVNIGLGKKAEGIEGISDIARRAHEDAVDDARRASIAESRNERAVGTAAGFGIKKLEPFSGGGSTTHRTEPTSRQFSRQFRGVR